MGQDHDVCIYASNFIVTGTREVSDFGRVLWSHTLDRKLSSQKPPDSKQLTLNSKPCIPPSYSCSAIEVLLQCLVLLSLSTCMLFCPNNLI